VIPAVSCDDAALFPFDAGLSRPEATVI
jgi:hypothetical protein